MNLVYVIKYMKIIRWKWYFQITMRRRFVSTFSNTSYHQLSHVGFFFYVIQIFLNRLRR